MRVITRCVGALFISYNLITKIFDLLQLSIDPSHVTGPIANYRLQASQ